LTLKVKLEKEQPLLSHYLLQMLIPSEAMPQTNKNVWNHKFRRLHRPPPIPLQRGTKGEEFHRLLGFLSVESVQSVVSVILFKS